MRKFRAFVIRLRGLYRSRRSDADFAAELESHVALDTEAGIRSGLTPEEARRLALIRLGGAEQTRQAYRERHGLLMLLTLWQDLRFGLRMLCKNPGFTAIAALTLALGMGANASIFSLINALYLKPLAVSHPESLLRVYAKGPSGHYGAGFSFPEFKLLRDRKTPFDAVAAETQVAQLHLVTADSSAEIRGAFVSANYFSLLGIQPRLGRSFLAGEDAAPNRDAVAVISDYVWKTQLNGDAAAVGREVHVNGISFKIIGVAPPGFHGDLTGLPVEIWMPAMMLGAAGYGCRDGSFNCSLFDSLIGRLASGQSKVRAQAEAASVMVWSANDWPERPSRRQLVLAPASGGDPDMQAESATQVRVLMAVTATLLLIVCANLSGLALARGVTRRKEIAIRLSLGASRSRVVRQLLTENLLLASSGGVLGLGFCFASRQLLSRFYETDSEGFHHLYDFSFDWRLLVYATCLALATGLAFGLIPALRASPRNPIAELKDSGSSDPRTTGWLRNALVIAQVALSMALAVSAALLVRSGLAVQQGTNFDPAHMLVIRLRPELVKYTPIEIESLIRRLNQRLSATPGVESAAFMQGGEGLVWNGANGRDIQVDIPGPSQAASGAGFMVLKQDVDPNFFSTLRIPVLQGRAFSEQDRPGSPRVAVLNQSLARRLWPTGVAVGSTAIIGGKPYEIIGVAADIQPPNPLRSPDPHLYLAYWQSGATSEGDVRMAIRVVGDPALALPAIRREIQSLDASLPIGEDMSMREQMGLEYMPVLLARSVMSFCGLLAICLSALGLYSVLAFTVRTRTREIGIRMALGARRGNVLKSVIGNGINLAIAGVVIGTITALGTTRVLASLLYGMKTSDPATYLGMGALLLLVALIACLVPAHRAASIDPMKALRTE